MFNTIVALGYLVKDPEIKQTQSGKSICMMRVCVSENNAKTKCFIDCEAWDKTAEACGKFLKKGREVLIEGELCMSSWTNKEGVEQVFNTLSIWKVDVIGGNATAPVSEIPHDDELGF